MGGEGGVTTPIFIHSDRSQQKKLMRGKQLDSACVRSAHGEGEAQEEGAMWGSGGWGGGSIASRISSYFATLVEQFYLYRVTVYTCLRP